MKLNLIAFTAFIAVVFGHPSVYYGDLPLVGRPVARIETILRPTTAIVPATYRPAELRNQYHSQDFYGQYAYGYSNGLSRKQEVKSLDGVTRGSYSYVDAAGKLQTVDYTADALNGFQVSATNLPKPIEALPVPEITELEPIMETDEVREARERHLLAVEEAKTARPVEPLDLPLPEPQRFNPEDLPKEVEETPEVKRAREEHFEAKKQAELRIKLEEEERKRIATLVERVPLRPAILSSPYLDSPLAPTLIAPPVRPTFITAPSRPTFITAPSRPIAVAPLRPTVVSPSYGPWPGSSYPLYPYGLPEDIRYSYGPRFITRF